MCPFEGRIKDFGLEEHQNTNTQREWNALRQVSDSRPTELPRAEYNERMVLSILTVNVLRRELESLNEDLDGSREILENRLESA